MVLFIRKSQLAVELEITEGTPNPPDAADAGFWVYDLTFAPDVQVVERDPLKAFLGTIPSLVGRISGTITGRVELAPSGVAGTAPSISKLLQICAISETVNVGVDVVYAPDSDAGDGDGTSGTCDFYLDGIRFRIFGARGNVVFTATAGEQGFAEFTMTGLIDSDSIADIPLLAGVVYPTVDPPVFLEAIVNIDGIGVCAESFALDAGNQVVLRPCVLEPSGYKAAAITSRDPSANLDPEMALVADRDDYHYLLDGTLFPLAVGWGQTPGNTVAFAAPTSQIKTIDQGDREGIATDPLDIGLRSSGTADDDWTLTFA